MYLCATYISYFCILFRGFETNVPTISLIGLHWKSNPLGHLQILNVQLNKTKTTYQNKIYI